jgi:integrase
VNAKEGEPSKVFHSFRHTFIGHLKMKRVPTEIFLEINGHAHGNESLDRYSPEYQARLGLDEVISKIDFHLTIPLDHLKNSKWCGPK